MTSSFCFSESVHKTCQRQPTELKLGKLIVHSKFHKVGKFENYVTRNDVIMMSLPKTMENNGEMRTSAKPDKLHTNRKVLMRAIKNVLCIEFEPLRQKLWAFLSNFGIFFKMPAHQIWSFHVTQEANFELFLFCPNSTFNIRKCHKISSGKALYVRSYQKNLTGGGKHPSPPSAFRVNRNIKSTVMQVSI